MGRTGCSSIVSKPTKVHPLLLEERKVACTPEANLGDADIYSGTSNTGKHPQFSQFNPRATNLFTTADKAEHRSRRRCIGTSFSDAQMKGFEGRLRGHVDKFCDLITSSPIAEGSEWSLPLQMSDSVGYFVFDTVTGFLLSQDYNLLGASKDRHIIRHIKQHTIRLAVCSYMPILALLKMDKLFFRRATRSTRIFWRWVKSAIASKGQQSEAPQDVFARIQLSRRSQESPTMGMLSDIFMFIVAGEKNATEMQPRLHFCALANISHCCRPGHHHDRPLRVALLSKHESGCLRATLPGSAHDLPKRKRHSTWTSAQILPIPPCLHRRSVAHVATCWVRAVARGWARGANNRRLPYSARLLCRDMHIQHASHRGLFRESP